MKKSNDLQTKQLYLSVILMVIWSMISAYFLITFSPVTALLGIGLNILILSFSLTQLFTFSSWASLIMSIALFAGAGFSLMGFNQDFLMSIGIGAGSFLITTILCEIYNHRIRKIYENYNRLQQVADSLVIYDRNTSLMRWKFARQSLSTEILRGRRYQNDVSLVLFNYRQRDQFSTEEVRRINRIIAEVLQDGIRTDIDIAFTNDYLGIILPETDRGGALVLTKRLIQRLNRQVDARVVAGLACFPEDAITDEEILERSQAALQIALTSDEFIVDYRSLASTKDSTQEEGKGLSQSLNIDDENVSREEYITILQDIHLADDEWIVWVEGFNKLSDLVHIEQSLREIDHIQSVEFLFLQTNHLVIRIRSSLANLINTEDPIPGWQIKKTDLESRYLLISQEKELTDHNDS